MELWTEYEGRTIDGAFPLKKLLLPEGRSAFFSTSNGRGEPTVIRLIASHYDEDEILARWRGVEALGNPNILRLEQFGQLVLDDTTVVYAVMEPVDANLGEVITDQRLPLAEARQLAASLISALEVLHSNGFVHEHVEPANIYAVGEVVKLRGDCIREAPEGQAGSEAKKRDIHNLGVVLLQALAQQSSLDAAGPRPALAAPFDRIVSNALNGSWGLSEIKTALGPIDLPKAPQVSPSVVKAASSSPVPVAKPISEVPARSATVAAAAVGAANERAMRSEAERPSRTGSFTSPADRPKIERAEDREPAEGLPRFTPRSLGVAAAVAVLLVVWLVWHFAHSSTKTPAVVAQPAPVTAPEAAPAPAAPARPVPAKPAARNTQRTSASDAPHEQWRVVAFTYNRQDQAQAKADFLSQKHPDLHPAVFSPTGRAPYLVTVGGVMSHDAAYALMHRSSHWGLPRDTYAQNYSGRSR